jgi:hypothetical protein
LIDGKLTVIFKCFNFIVFAYIDVENFSYKNIEVDYNLTNTEVDFFFNNNFINGDVFGIVMVSIIILIKLILSGIYGRFLRIQNNFNNMLFRMACFTDWSIIQQFSYLAFSTKNIF